MTRLIYEMIKHCVKLSVQYMYIKMYDFMWTCMKILWCVQFYPAFCTFDKVRVTVYWMPTIPLVKKTNASEKEKMFCQILNRSRKCYINEPPHNKTNKKACVPSKDYDQPGHPPSLIRVFTVCLKKTWVLSYPLSAQRTLWSDWANAQADLSLRWAHNPFVGFVMRRLIYPFSNTNSWNIFT